MLAAVSSHCGDVREYSAGNSSSTFSVSQRFAPRLVDSWSRQEFFRVYSEAAVADEGGGVEAGSPEVERVYKELNESTS